MTTVFIAPVTPICSACTGLLFACWPVDTAARIQLVECRIPTCSQYGIRLRMPLTVVECETDNRLKAGDN